MRSSAMAVRSRRRINGCAKRWPAIARRGARHPPTIHLDPPDCAKRAGSGAHPSANRIALLRESKQGTVEKHVFLQDLNSPIGMALVGNTFFVADSDAVLSFPYRPGDMEIKSAPTELTALPAGTINHHWTKSLLASPDGQHLYVGVGSNSN